MTDLRDDPTDVTAAELALGVLEGDDRAAALRRLLAEPAFAAEVAWWRDRFAELVAAVPAVDPGPALFGRIERSLDAPAAPKRGGRLWPSIAGLTTLAAAASLALLVSRPAPPPPAPVPTATPQPLDLLAAAITPTGEGQGASEPLAAVYQRNTGTVRLGATALGDARHSAQLWVIGTDGVPYSLGLLNGRGTTLIRLTAANRRRLGAAATLAISIEPVGGSPIATPTGPVVATGKLSRT